MSIYTFINKNKEELGVELELEGFADSFSLKKDFPKSLRKKYILDVVKDGTVDDDGTEINFKYFPLPNWKYQEIVEIYNILSSFRFHAGKSAGMHIHYSGPKLREVYKIYAQEKEYLKSTDNFGFITECFHTIGARNQAYHGVYNDLWKPNVKDKSTMEVRAFESTMNPYIFYTRIHVTYYIINQMSKKTYSEIITNLFNDMPDNIKNMFWFLTKTENPNKYGFSRDFIYNKLFNNGLQKY